MKNKVVYVAMSGGVDSSVAAALLKEQGYGVTGVFMKFWSPDENSFCLWKEERADAARVAAKLSIPLLTWDFTHEYEKKVVAYMLEAYKSGITPNPDIMCNKEIKFGLFFDKAIAEGADFVATGHYSRISYGNPKSEFLISNKIPNSKSQVPNNTLARVIVGEGWGEGNNLTIKQFNNYQLYQAVDKNKDQSYFLYTLDQRHLEKTLFPIGEYTKPEVRELAKKFGLSIAEKRDSQGVCFIGPLKMKSFLKDYIKPKRGRVILIQKSKIKSQNEGDRSIVKLPRPNSDLGEGWGEGNNLTMQQFNNCHVLGFHDGAYYYTIGQRHGIDLKLAGGPYYVVGKNIEKNEVYVGREEDLYSDEAEITNVHWIGETPKLPARFGVKIRYRSETVPVTIDQGECTSLTVIPTGVEGSFIRIGAQQDLSTPLHFARDDKQEAGGTFQIKFKKPVRAITPGQSAVFYDGENVLGGGIIK